MIHRKISPYPISIYQYFRVINCILIRYINVHEIVVGAELFDIESFTFVHLSEMDAPCARP